MQHKLVFLYDKLMTSSEREKILLKADFLAYGQMQAKMFWMITRRVSNKNYYKNTRRIFAIPKDTTKVIYGGIFSIPDWEVQSKKLCAYYYNSSAVCGHTLKEDMFELVECAVKPIKFSKLSDLVTCKYDAGNEIMCNVFIGNVANERVYYNSTNEKYYGEKRIDKNSFIKMIKEKNNGLE